MVNKSIVIRADAAVEIGTGHIMRCLTLAQLLREHGAKVLFICRELAGHLCELIQEQGFNVHRLPSIDMPMPTDCEAYSSYLAERWQEDALLTQQFLTIYSQVDCLIVDHYALDEKWERLLKPYVKNIMVIDDLANRQHICDVLVDQNLSDNMITRYQSLVPDSCCVLLGPQYAVLRPEFIQQRYSMCNRNGKIQRIFMFFGGSDPTNETEKALQACKTLKKSIIIDVVVGISNPYREKIKNICAEHSNFNYYCQIDYMARLMARTDIAIGAGGSVTWERCCVGLPALVTILADNQHELTTVTAKRGAIINMGRHTEVTSQNYIDVLNRTTEPILLQMQKRALELVDGQGGKRIINQMLLLP